MAIVLKKTYEIISTGKSINPVDYHVTFRLNDKCNLSCEYCRWYDGENYDKPIETINAIFNFFEKMKYKAVLFYFHGGEASIHPQVIETLEYLRLKEKETGIRTIIEFQTNMSYSLNKFKKIVGIIDELSISYHFVDLWKTNTHYQFVRNFCWLKLNNKSIERFDIMLENVPDDQLEDFYKNILWFLSYDGIVDSEMIHGFCHYSKNPIVKQKHIDFYNKYNKTEQLYKVDGVIYNTNDLFTEGLDCQGCKCDAGTNDIMLNADGNVFTCGIEMTYYRMGCQEAIRPITNILTDNNYSTILKIKTKIKTTCKFDYCGGDFYFMRYRE